MHMHADESSVCSQGAVLIAKSTGILHAVLATGVDSSAA